MKNFSSLWRKFKGLLKKPFYGVYVLLFGTSCIVIFQTIVLGIDKQFDNQINVLFTILLIFSSITHVFLIYLSIHDIEENSAIWKTEYSDWIGGKAEILTRWIIVILLISFAGKGFFNHIPPALVGTVLMFSLILWDILSSVFSSNNNFMVIFSLARTEGKFFYSDLLGLIVWGAFLSSDKDIILLITHLAAVLYLVIIGHRMYQFHRNDYQFIATQPSLKEMKK